MFNMDWVIVGVVGVSILTGFMRGFLKELVALCAWVLGFWLAFRYGSLAAEWLTPYIHDKTLRTVAGFLLVVLLTLIVGSIINALLGFILRHAGLHSSDRILGMGFGFVRGVFIVSLGLSLVTMGHYNLKPYQSSSQIYPYLDPMVGWISTHLQPLLLKTFPAKINPSTGLPEIPALQPTDELTTNPFN